MSSPAQTINLSHFGVLVESSEQLLPHEGIIFELITNDARRIEIPGRIAWVKQEANNVYRVGVAFRNLTPDEEYLLDLELVRTKSN